MKNILSIILVFVASMTFAQKGEKLIEQYIDAIGGKEKLSSIKSILKKGNISQMGQELEFETYQNIKGDGYMKMNMMGMQMNVYGIKDGKGYTMNMQSMGYDEMDEETAKKFSESSKELYGDVTTALMKHKEIKYLGQEEMNGKKYEVIEIKDENSTAKVYFDPKTHLVKYMMVESEQGPITLEIAEYVETKGVKFPKVIITKLGDQEISKATLTEVIVNPDPSKIDQSAFTIPE